MIQKVRLIAGIALLVLLIVFIATNWKDAEVRFLVGQVQMPVGFVVLFSALTGVAVYLVLRAVRKNKPKSQ